MTNQPLDKINEYSDAFEKSSFLDTLGGFFKKVGKESVLKSLQLYYALDSDKCNVAAKAKIYGALGYLVSPIDLIPDLTPVLGYTDDVAVIAWALAQVAWCIDQTVKENAVSKMEDWFGS